MHTPCFQHIPVFWAPPRAAPGAGLSGGSVLAAQPPRPPSAPLQSLAHPYPENDIPCILEEKFPSEGKGPGPRSNTYEQMNPQKEFQLKKLILTAILLGLSGVSAFAKPTWYTAFDVVLPMEFWSAGGRNPVNSADIVIGGGFNAKAFYPNNFGFFMDFGMGGLLSQTEINGKEPITKPISVFVSGGQPIAFPCKEYP